MIALRFYEGRKGDVIARHPSGKVAVVNRRSKKRPKAGEKWLCRVDKELPNVVIVTPAERVVRKTKTTEVYDEYECGHRVLRRVDREDVEVPESVTPQKEIRVYRVPRPCDECLRKKQETCVHEKTELITTGSWITVTCKECEKELFCVENPIALSREEVEEVAEKIRELAGEEKEREFREFIEKLREYEEKIQKIRELEKRLDDVFEEIQRTLGEIKFVKWIYGREPESTEFIKVPMFSEEFGGGVEFKWISVKDEATAEKLRKLSEEFAKVREMIRKLEEETPRVRFE